MQVRFEAETGGGGTQEMRLDNVEARVTYRTINQAAVSQPTFPSNVCLQANFNFVVDVSASVNTQTGGQGIQQLRDGIEGFVQAYEAIGDGRYSLSRFSDSGTLLTDNPDFVDADTLLPLLSGIASGTYTNTADGIDKALSADVNNGGYPGAPKIMFIITDGSPNRYPGDSGSPSLSNPQVWLNAADQAIARADAARQAGYIVYSIFVGEGDENLPWSSAGDQEWINAVMLQYVAGNASYARSGAFADLAEDLLSSVCGGTLSVTKVIQDESGQTIAAPSDHHSGWSFPATSTNGNVNLPVTNTNGNTSAQINFGASPSSQITVSETNKNPSLYTMVSAECKIGNTVVGSDGDGSDGLSIPAFTLQNNQTASCTFINRLVPQQRDLTVCKVYVNNGVAPVKTDQGFGIRVDGSSIGLAVVSEGGPPSCLTTQVTPGSNPTISEVLPSGFANEDGYPRWSVGASPVANPGTQATAFTGSFQPGAINQDTTVFIYNREAVHTLQVCKVLVDNGAAPVLSNQAFGITVGGTSIGTATVDEGGDAECVSVQVSHGATVNVGETLPTGFISDPDYPRQNTGAQTDPANAAQFEGTFSVGPITADTTAHIYNRAAIASVSIVKKTNGSDNNTAPGPYLPVGSTVTWTYEVTNTGDVPLSDIVVTDDKEGTIQCLVDSLAPGNSTTCTKTGTVVAGPYTNMGTVTTTTPDGQNPTDNDPDNHFGVQPNIQIIKYTDGADANDAPGLQVPVGSQVTFTYDVTVATGSGSVPLANVVVTDDGGPGAPFNPSPVLDGGFNVGDTNQNNRLDPGETWKYESAPHTVTAGQYTNIGTATGNPVTPEGDDIPGVTDPSDTDPSNHFGTQPGISIVKLTNGVDYNESATGPYLPVGSTVTWTYIVTNTGNVPLSTLTVTDDIEGDITCPVTTLAPTGQPGDSVTCTETGIVQEGQYENMATATGTPPDGPPPSDSDPDRYFGVDPDIRVVKKTNGVDHGTTGGPNVPVGSEVTFTYEVTNPSLATNPGGVPLASVVVTDDNGTPGVPGDDFNPTPTLSSGFNVGDTNQNNLLDPGETWIYTYTRIATAGTHVNVATATGNPVTPAGDDIPGAENPTASDPDNHFGTTSGVSIVKKTNGSDNNTAPGPYLPVGSTVTWTYEVTNLGNLPLSSLEVSDDIEGEISCPATTLAPNGQPGDSMTCTKTGTVEPGQYTNIGSVTGTPPSGPPVGDEDPDNYFGYELGIKIVKYTNGDDANAPTGPLVLVGSTVTFTYDVTNEGNLPLASVTVVDDNGTPGDTGDDFNPAPVLDGGFNVGDTNQNGRLDVGEVWKYSATHTATAGQYTNIGTVTGDPTDPEGNPLELPQQTDSDPSNHYGQEQYTVTVCKIVVGNGDGQPNGGTFTFSSLTQGLSGMLTATEGATAGADGEADCSLTATVIEGANVTVSESASRPAGWTADAVGYPTTSVNGATPVSQSSVTVTDIQDDVTITFRNRAEPLQRLRVCKDVIDSQQGAPATDWSFNSSLFDGTVIISGVEAAEGLEDNCSAWVEIPWGTQSVTVTETDPGSSWDTNWIVNTNPVQQGTDNTGDRTATFDLGSRKDHTLVFTNSRVLIPVQVCKRVIDNGAAPGGEGDTFPVVVDYTRNGQPIQVAFELTQNENNDSTETSCATVLVDRGTTVTVDEDTLPAGWAAAGATQGSTTPPAEDNLPFTSSSITAEGQTIYVFNQLDTFDVTVCKVIDQNEDIEGTESGTFNFGGDLGTFSLVADSECHTVTVSSGADITVTENGAPLNWRDALDYPQVQVNEDARTTGTNTVTVTDITADTTITFYNKLAPNPELSKVPADIVYADGFARWQIIIDNTADGAREHRVSILDADVVLNGDAPVACDSGDITNSEDPLSCLVAPGTQLVINVQRAIGQTCTGGEAANTALIRIGEGAAQEVTSPIIEIPADEELCDDPLIEKETLGYNAANGIVSWEITIDNSDQTVEGAIDRTIVITDPGVTLVGGLPAGCTGAIATGMTCEVAADTVLTFEVQRAVTEQCHPGQAANQATATVDGANIQGSPANAAPVTIPADESDCIVPPLDKDAIGYSVDEQTASWTITVDNRGGDSIERTVVITDDNVAFVSQSPTNACTSGELATGLTCTIPAGTLLTLTVEREVAQTCQPGVAINTAEATLDGAPLPGSPAVAAPIIIPGSEALCDLPDLSKVATGYVTASSMATWRIVVANDAPGAIDRTVVITDASVDVALTLPAGACDTANTDIQTGLVCEVAAGATLQLFVTRGPIGQICAPQQFTNTATGMLLNGEPLDGSPTGAVTVTVPALTGQLCGEIEIPTPTPPITPEPEETPTPTSTPEPTAVLPTVVEPPTSTPEPTAVLPTVVVPPTEEPTATNTPEPTATSTPEPTAVLPTVVVPTPPDSGTGFSPMQSNEPTFLVGLLGLLLLGAGAAIVLDGYRNRV